ncbi:putative addiction module toxin [Selenomonas ruminantium subsp. lactilytica TAM6421]|uniref:Putative addiction module toxin n=1 Tax=Selenomonas ruminantium subsp. lactilytica (strain NBRC 103574 / TAM6421) TaxID=927704 RepID=I0GRX4_SELRL|nr:type II toxin-antitoxin system YafQ family toxin [Selenomonas ruminantium]BAL83511.1 putative addiction module toxin [Selenomonas ruminantium subsp. lactilytica TAM6421]
MKLKLQVYTQFKKDVKLAKKRHYDMSLLKKVIDTLANGEKLDDKYRDHALVGNYVGYRECHILPDWLLVYKIVDNELTLVLARTGTHSDLF